MPERNQGWFTGILVPVTTPFDPVTGEVAPIDFRENLRRWVQAPVDGIVLFGTNGEGKLLDLEEKIRLIGYARDIVPAELPLIVGAGAESTRATIAEVRRFAEEGADAALVSPPPYFAPLLTAGAVRDHFMAIADVSPIPILVYHIPKYTHITMEPGLIREFSRHENIVGLKDSSGDLKRFADYTMVCPADFRLLIGNGALLYSALELGAAGGIVALGLLAPHECGRLYRHFRAGEAEAAGAIQTRLAPVHRGIVGRFGPPGVKAALDRLGFVGGKPRPPLTPLGPKDQRQVARLLQEAALI